MLFEGEGCGDPCGWMAAFIAALAYGSYGVPIKATMDLHEPVHPLVLQTYKTAVLFTWSVCFGLLFSHNHQDQFYYKWTSYGVVSGFLWVGGGCCGIVAIRQAGMALAVGTWAAVMVGVNFIWGMLVFQEPVHSLAHTCVAFATLGVGLVGMSHYSSSSSAAKEAGVVLPSKKDEDAKMVEEEEEGEEIETVVQSTRFSIDKESLTARQRRVDDEEVDPMIQLLLSTKRSSDDDDETEDDEDKKLVHTIVAGIPLTQRESGIFFAVLNGLLAGSSLIPMHFAKAQGFMGRSYIWSFGSGSMIANLVIWVGYFVYLCVHQNHNNNKNGSSDGGRTSSSWRTTYDLMPHFQWKELWFRGCMAGLLLTIGMFGAIFAIAILGQGVGNSLVQSKILISGLWGIFYFKEVKDPKAIGKWFASATVCVASILWLSYERNLLTSKGG